MPSFSRGLEKALHQAMNLARERAHEFATLEHLLLSLIDDTDAAKNLNPTVLEGTSLTAQKGPKPWARRMTSR